MSALPLSQTKKPKFNSIRIQLPLKSVTEQEVTNVESSDLTVVTVGYRKLAEEDGERKFVLKMATKMKKFHFARSPILLRHFNSTNWVRHIVPTNSMPYSKVKGIAKSRHLRLKHYPMFLLLDNATKFAANNDKRLRLADISKHSLYFLEMIVEDGYIRDQCCERKNHQYKNYTRLIGNQQERYFQVLIRGNAEDLSFVHSTHHCELCNRLAQALNGQRVKQDQGYVLPEQWVFPNRHASLVYFALAIVIGRGNDKFFGNLRKSARKPHTQQREESNRVIAQLPNKDKKRLKKKEERSVEDGKEVFYTTGFHDPVVHVHQPYIYAITKPEVRVSLLFFVPSKFVNSSVC